MELQGRELSLDLPPELRSGDHADSGGEDRSGSGRRDLKVNLHLELLPVSQAPDSFTWLLDSFNKSMLSHCNVPKG